MGAGERGGAGRAFPGVRTWKPHPEPPLLENERITTGEAARERQNDGHWGLCHTGTSPDDGPLTPLPLAQAKTTDAEAIARLAKASMTDVEGCATRLPDTPAAAGTAWKLQTAEPLSFLIWRRA